MTKEERKRARIELTGQAMNAYIILNDKQRQSTENIIVDSVWMADRMLNQLEETEVK